MKKILLVSHSQKTGGAEKCLFEAAQGLRARGFDVIVFMPSSGELTELLSKEDIKTKVLPYPWWVHRENQAFGLLKRIRSFLSILRYSISLMREMKKVNPDYVMTNTICIPSGALSAFFLRKKHIWFIHEFGKEDHQLLFDFGTYVSTSVIKLTSREILVNSEALKEKYQRHLNPKLISVVNINIPKPLINEALNREINDKQFDLLLVGQVTPNKGQLDALQALKELITEGYQARLLIVGQASDEQYYKTLLQFIEENDLGMAVSFTAHHAFPFSVVERFTIGLMCSEFEALGRVTIEYMKAGIPVIGANAGTTKLLINDKYGLLYELRDPKDLASKIKKMIHDKELVERITASARTFAETNFNETGFINGILSALNRAS